MADAVGSLYGQSLSEIETHLRRIYHCTLLMMPMLEGMNLLLEVLISQLVIGMIYRAA